MVSFHARDLTKGLLVKEPEDCLETFKGVIDMKKNSFFEGLNWAIIHSAIPLELPNFCDAGIGSTAISVQKKESAKFDYKDLKDTTKCVEFELF